MSWEEIAADKRSRIAASIPPEWRITSPPSDLNVMGYPKMSGIMSDDELNITESTATDLVPRLASGQLTSVAVTTAFLKRAALAHQLLNCALEFFPEIALARARELDSHFEKTGQPVGPLHGLPISLKDQCKIKGLETSMGYVSWIGKYAEEDSVIVSLLYKAGAVFYVKTSVPQSLMICETLNNVIGRSLNPWNKNLSPGGSSGGEGAMVGFRGGVIGVGTDLGMKTALEPSQAILTIAGGSIRVPAAFNYLYGLRPSHGRLPYSKMVNSLDGQETVPSVCGPIAHSVQDMRLFVQSLLAEEPWKYDSKVVPIPWRQSEHDTIKKRISTGGLTIAYYSSNGVVLPHPPVIRAVNTIVSTLKKAGHNVIDWAPYKVSYAHDLVTKIYLSDGASDINNTLKESGEPSIPNLGLPWPEKLNINELWDVHREKYAFQCEYLEQIRLAEEKLGKEIDAIITPVAPTAAIRHDNFFYYAYTNLVNLLDFTSVTVPVTFADKNIDKKQEDYKPLNESDRTNYDEYDAEAYHGAPVAVQIIGKRLSEERILAIAEEIGDLNRSASPSADGTQL